MPGAVFFALRQLWLARGSADEYIGTLVNAYLAEGGEAIGIKAGRAYVDIGTLNGYRTAIGLLADMTQASNADCLSTIGWPAGHLPRQVVSPGGARP
jgi:hypothetical protein